MEGAVNQRWLEFCELAAKEQDPKKLLLLVEEINRVLEEKEQRFKAKRQANQPDQIENREKVVRPCRNAKQQGEPDPEIM
jgi:hypothetical protein